MTSRPNIRTKKNGTLSVCFACQSIYFFRSFPRGYIIGDAEPVAIYLADRISKTLAEAPKGRERDTMLAIKDALGGRRGRPRAMSPVTAETARAEIDKAFRKLETKPRHE